MSEFWDAHYMARFYAGTIRGIDPEKAVPLPLPPKLPDAATLAVLCVAWTLPIPVAEKIEALEQAAAMLRESGIEVERLELEAWYARSVDGDCG